MAIKGNLREAGLPDVLQLLAMGQKTGCLSLTDRSLFGYIYFDRGRITYASIVNRRDRLGDLLVKNSLLAPRTSPPPSRSRPQPGRPAGRDPGAPRQHHPRAAAAVHPHPDRRGGLLPLHLDPGLLPVRARPAPGRGGDAGLDQPREPAARGRAADRRVEPGGEEDPLAGAGLRDGPGASDRGVRALRGAAQDPAADRRQAQRAGASSTTAGWWSSTWARRSSASSRPASPTRRPARRRR